MPSQLRTAESASLRQCHAPPALGVYSSLRSSMHPPDDHRDVIFAWRFCEERRCFGDDRVAHLTSVERGGLTDRCAEPFLAVFLAGFVLAFDDAVGVPNEHVA